MHHIARLSKRFEARPSHIECSCGVAGDFLTDSEARSWMESYHFRFLTGISTSEIASASPYSDEPPSDSREGQESEGGPPGGETVGDA